MNLNCLVLALLTWYQLYIKLSFVMFIFLRVRHETEHDVLSIPCCVCLTENSQTYSPAKYIHFCNSVTEYTLFQFR